MIVVLRSEKQARDGVTAEQREAETAAAMQILGCTWEQWPTTDLEPDWPAVANRLTALEETSHVFAPAKEKRGHQQHNDIAALAEQAFGRERITSYLTYTTEGRSAWGQPVPYEPKWVALKLRALLCYESQIARADQIEHFLRDLHEYVSA